MSSGNKKPRPTEAELEELCAESCHREITDDPLTCLQRCIYYNESNQELGCMKLYGKDARKYQHNYVCNCGENTGNCEWVRQNDVSRCDKNSPLLQDKNYQCHETSGNYRRKTTYKTQNAFTPDEMNQFVGNRTTQKQDKMKEIKKKYPSKPHITCIETCNNEITDEPEQCLEHCLKNEKHLPTGCPMFYDRFSKHEFTRNFDCVGNAWKLNSEQGSTCSGEGPLSKDAKYRCYYPSGHYRRNTPTKGITPRYTQKELVQIAREFNRRRDRGSFQDSEKMYDTVHNK